VSPSKGTNLLQDVHLVEWRNKDSLAGRWSAWHPLDTYFTTFRRAKRERDMLCTGGGAWSLHAGYQARVVSFRRRRTYLPEGDKG